MNNFLVLLGLLSSFSLYGQLDFAEYVLSDNSVLPELVRQIQVADLDGDGDVDLITASAVDEKIAWFENVDGEGNFSEQRIVSTNINSAQTVGHGDMDGDGDIDLVASDRIDSKIYIFLNDGFGHFTETLLFDPNTQEEIEPIRLSVADVDADGRVDVIVHDQSSNALLLYRNVNNQGDFVRETITNLSTFNRDYEVGDIDNDGDIDIVTTNQANTINKLEWHEYIDDGYTSHDIALENTYSQIELADMDLDGDLDIVVGSSFTTPTRVAWIEFNIDFGEVHFLTDESISIRSLEVADINQDGFPNVIYDAEMINGLSWIEDINAEDELVTHVIPQANALISSIIFAHDINDDGYADIITEGQSLHVKWFYYRPSTNDFSQAFTVPSQTNGAINIFSIDVDEDDDLDVISTSAFDGRIGWFENYGSINEFDRSQKLIYDHGTFLSGSSMSDIDGDGDDDIVGFSWYSKDVFWIRNEGNASFSEMMIIGSLDSGINAMSIGDIDNDGDQDIVVTASSQVFLYENNFDGGEIFEPADTIYNDIPLDVLLLRDMDGDQDLDLIIRGCCNDASTLLLENMDGQGTLAQPRTIIPNGEYSSLFETLDIDDDGDLDIFISPFFENGTYLLYNQNGDFSSDDKIFNQSCYSIVAEDFDFDGDTDLIASTDGFSGDQLVWYENVSEFFLEYDYHEISDEEVGGIVDIELVDWEGDGDKDILTASVNYDKISLFNNYDPVSTTNISSFKFSISPVPATTSLKIETDVTVNKVMIYNIEGKFKFVSSTVSEIDISSLVSGMYIIQVVDVEGKSSAMKFMKE